MIRLCTIIILLSFSLSVEALGQSLEWQDLGSHRLAKLKIRQSDKDGFALLPNNETGLLFANKLSRMLVARNRNLANGSGVAVGDINGDGLADVYFCGLQTDNKLFRNLGDWKFEDVTQDSGVACPRQYSTGALIEDIDGDGDNDLLVTGLAKGIRLFLNDGNGRFTEDPNSGLFPKLGATSMAIADYDLDGDLDLYVTNYRTTNYKDRPPGVNVSVTQEGGKIVVSPSSRFTYLKTSRTDGVNIVELGEPDFLYKNLGGGKFKPVGWTKGAFLDADGRPLAKPPLDWGLSVAIRDFNDDQLPDIYVCNDYFYSVDKFWINQGNGTFKLADHQVVRNYSMSSMSVDCADINLDGYNDYFVADMLSRRMSLRKTQRANVLSPDIQLPISQSSYQPEFPRNTLQLGRGDGSYVEIAQLAGLDASEWTWGSRFLDVDLDGYQDLILTTGNEADVLDADMLRVVAQSPTTRDAHIRNMMNFPRLESQNLIFHNNGDLTFTDRSVTYGFGQESISHGMAAADLDNDGDLDLVINNLNEPAYIFKNIGDANRVSVRLRGISPNTNAVGSMVELKSELGAQRCDVVSGGRYLSGDQPQCVFAVPKNSPTVSIQVRWPDGHTTILENIPINSMVEVVQEKSEIVRLNVTPPRVNPMFVEATLPSSFAHEEKSFDDFSARPLLPLRESTMGPGLAAADLDGDFIDELLLGAGKGGSLKGIKWQPENPAEFALMPWSGDQKVIRDVHSILVLSKRQGEWEALIAQSNLEDGLAVGNSLIQIQGGIWKGLVDSGVFGAGPMAMADVDADGDLDLFIGGIANHGDSFSEVSSYLMLNVNGQFEVSSSSGIFKNIGSTTGVVFSDVDNDLDPDLLLSRRWSSPLLFINEGGKFLDRSTEWGMVGLNGLWNGVVTADFNADGKMDFVMSNMGRNSKYTRYLDDEVWLHVADYNRDGIAEGVESVVDPYLAKRVPMRDLDTLAKVMPWIHDMYPTYRAFGQAAIESLLAPLEAPPRLLKLNILDTSLFLNQGNTFIRKPLPVECLVAPALGCSVADFNGDGFEDLYLAQNFFDVEPESSRFDAGCGLVMLGDGEGGFRVLSRSHSGLIALGQARSSVVSDLNGDGRVDIATAQNNEQAKVHLNQTGQAGVRVILLGKGKNPAAVGASIIPIVDGKQGPKREINLGSGYLSQDGRALVFAATGEEAALLVNWPGSGSGNYKIPKGAKTITITEDNGVRVVQ